MSRKGRFGKASVRDADVAGRTVLVRADLNVPLAGCRVGDDTRIRAALPTIELLLERGARVVLCSHLGRPRGRDPELSMAPVATRLGELLGTDVGLAPGVAGDDVAAAVGRLRAGRVLLLENTRWEPGEKENDPALAAALAALADVYVNDAFGAAHRAHASTEGVAHLLPAYAGLLLEREVRELTSVLADPERPLVVVLGGAKVTDKVGVIDRFLEIADRILIGGAMCFSFFRAQGRRTGDSLVEEDGIGPARRALERAAEGDCELELPVDLVLGASFSADADPVATEGVDVPDGMVGLDIGPRSAARYAEAIAAAGTVFWNGPMGAFELAPFAAGTRAVADAVAAADATTIVGGGDSAAALAEFGLADRVGWLSTGGGASLELIEGKPLPGVEALLDAGEE
ncbi:MAG: phosphoglycerate kinase [Acidobacteria bacterium]|nr:MAG: phosphoglycerate kinase [Acidobacteriota bacterium]GIK77533.1 MAG: phosphoglycerate kinase [Actinomycetes bacterium]